MTPMPPIDMLCYYKVSKSDEAAFLALLERLWPMLHKVGLATDVPAKVSRCEDKKGNVVFVEEYQWADEGSAGLAHQSPEVMQTWEPMGALTKGNMEFWHVKPVAMSYQK